jgi:hypothetical protein
MPEVTWIYGPYGMGEIEWADKYLGLYDTLEKVGNYYLNPTKYKKNLVYNCLDKEKYSDILQMCTNNHMELKIKYRYYNLLPEKLVIICRYDPHEWSKKCKPLVNDCSELLKESTGLFALIGITKLILLFILNGNKCL